MTIFNTKYDWIIATLFSWGLIYIYYGFWPAIISAIFVSAFSNLSYTKSLLTLDDERYIIAFGALLVFSPIYRFIFQNDFCLNSPIPVMWNFVLAANGTVASGETSSDVANIALITIRDMCKEEIGKWWFTNLVHYPRDVYPIIGLISIAFALRLRRMRSK